MEMKRKEKEKEKPKGECGWQLEVAGGSEEDERRRRRSGRRARAVVLRKSAPFCDRRASLVWIGIDARARL